MSICFGDLVKVNGAVGISRVETHYSIAAVPGAIEALERLEMTAGQPAMDDDPVRVHARDALRAVRGEESA